MFSRTKVLVTAAFIAASMTLAGCSTDSGSAGRNANDSGMMGGDSPSSSDSFNMADIQFVAMMLPHHEQAVEMADILLAKSDIDPAVAELAQQIKDAQEPEIEQMDAWIEEWGVDMGSMGGMDGGMSGMDHSMNGMMSDDDMQSLEEATGDDASRVFLEGMTEHHEGAIEMADAEIDNGKDPEVIALAEEIRSSQTSEIETMKELLAQL